MQTCIHTYIHTYIHTCTCIHEHIWKDDLFDKYILISLHVQTNLECFLLFIRLAGCKIICLIDFHMRIFFWSKSSQCLMSQRQSHTCNANIMHKNTRISGLTPHSIHYQVIYILVHSLNPLDLVISVPSTILLQKKEEGANYSSLAW
jgi:hypothetical protein